MWALRNLTDLSLNFDSASFKVYDLGQVTYELSYL